MFIFPAQIIEEFGIHMLYDYNISSLSLQKIYIILKKECWQRQGSNQGPSAPELTALSITPRGH